MNNKKEEEKEKLVYIHGPEFVMDLSLSEEEQRKKWEAHRKFSMEQGEILEKMRKGEDLYTTKEENERRWKEYYRLCDERDAVIARRK